jgi:membrane-associated protease RseP (regulator of RpoE activity)
VRSHDEFIQFISVRRGERIPVIVLRDGRQETIYVVYDGGPDVQVNVGNQQGAALLGVTFDANVQHAAVIAAVHPGGPAAQIGLKPGDHIVSINGRRIDNAQSAVQIVGTMRPGDQVELEFLQLQRTQLVLSQPGNIQASANVGGQVGVAQGTYQTNYPPSGATQASGQVQVNQNQDQNMNRPQPQPQNRNQNQPSNQNRSLIPRLRN